MRITTITKAGLVAAAAMLVATGTAVANEGATYSTGFGGETITVNDATQWRMTGGYDAAIVNVHGDSMLRISNATTSGSFGDMLYSPELAEGATEDGPFNKFESTFTLAPVELQPGLRVTMSPDNGSGARAGFLAIEHRDTGLALVTIGSSFNEEGELVWSPADVVTDLDPMESHTVKMKLIKKPDNKKSSNNDVFSVKVDGKPVKNTTFEAYYDAVSSDETATDTMLFRLSGDAAPELAGAGLLIDDFTMSVS
jgi:hypothetical protein